MNSSSCQICGRQLTDPTSIAAGVGPECAAKRTGFLSTCGTTEAELTTLETANPDAARWVRNFRTEMRAGNVRWAKKCLDAARYRAQPVAPVAVAEPMPAPVAVAPVQTIETAEPFITVRQIERGGYYVRTPFKLAGFVEAFKRVVGGTWHPEKEEWYVPAVHLTWTVGAIEYWFGLPVRVERQQNYIEA